MNSQNSEPDPTDPTDLRVKPFDRVSDIQFPETKKGCCIVCGKKIKMMCYLMTDFCSQQCEAKVKGIHKITTY